ncbi:MAG: hypothetical protein GXO76_04065 [Calditrichaeota bacterium]|nr:hypothetical protein [Calditrichota bacterium]
MPSGVSHFPKVKGFDSLGSVAFCQWNCRVRAGTSALRSRSGGMRMGKTLRRNYKSSRKRPFLIIPSRTRLVAADFSIHLRYDPETSECDFRIMG